MRMRSPSTAPPVSGLEGSIATTATRWPRVEQLAQQRVDERRLACARRPGDADDVRACRALRRDGSAADRAAIGAPFSSARDRARDRAPRRRLRIAAINAQPVVARSRSDGSEHRQT